MTRISSAQRGLNAFIDQIVNARSDASAASGNATAGGFDSHLATFNPNAGGNSQPEDSNAPLFKIPKDDASGTQKDLADSLAAFGSKGAMDAAVSGPSASTDSVSTLFAALRTEEQSTASVPVSSPINITPSQVSIAGQLTIQSQDVAEQSSTPLSVLLSLANNTVPAASDSDSEPAATGAQKPQMAQTRVSFQKASDPAAANVKRPANLKQTDQNSASSNDLANNLAASAQVTVAAVAIALTPQNTPQLARKDTPLSVSNPNIPNSRSDRASLPSSQHMQIQSDAVQAQSPGGDSFDLFGDSSDQAASSARQPIKMTVTSVQAETHFAPVQQLSPTQQIVDFVASAAGSAPVTDAADNTATNSPALDMTTSTTASLAASPVKTLTLSLEPEALGSVTITMRLVNSNLELKVEAEKPETTSLIEKDKDNLSDKLQSLGYSVDSMVVKTSAAQGAHLDSSNDQTAAGQGQQAANDASSSGASQHGGRNAQDQSQTRGSSQSGAGLYQDTGADPSNRSISDGVYI